MKRICRDVKIPEITAYGMRGTHSTVALDFGQTPLVVAAALGHESPSTTLGNYAAPGAGAAAQQARVAAILDGDAAQRNAQAPEQPLRPSREVYDCVTDSVELNGIEPSAS